MSHRVSIASFESLPGWMLRGAAIGGLFLAASAASGQNAPPATPEKPRAAQSAARQSGAVAPTATTRPAAPAEGAAPRALREAMAELLEAHWLFRTRFGKGLPRLFDAKFAGPLQRRVDLFRSPETVYCARSKIDTSPWAVERDAMLRVVTDESGKQRIVATISASDTPVACRALVFKEPFPELEAARERSRRAAGVKD